MGPEEVRISSAGYRKLFSARMAGISDQRFSIMQAQLAISANFCSWAIRKTANAQRARKLLMEIPGIVSHTTRERSRIYMLRSCGMGRPGQGNRPTGNPRKNRGRNFPGKKFRVVLASPGYSLQNPARYPGNGWDLHHHYSRSPRNA